MADPILVERDGDVATVVINRPEKRNALNVEAWSALAEAMNALSDDESLRCIVLRGTGREAFAAGADISGFESERSTPALVRTYSETTHRAFDAVEQCRHPVVAMIHGFCLGGGFELATACDLRIAGESGRFGVPVKRMGLYLGYQLLETLISVVGRATALEIVLEGRVFDSAEALAKGMVTRVVADDALEEECGAMVRRIAEGAPLSARWHKQAARRLSDPAPLTDGEIEGSYAYAESEDYHAAYRAFLAKKKPRFQGR